MVRIKNGFSLLLFFLFVITACISPSSPTQTARPIPTENLPASPTAEGNLSSALLPGSDEWQGVGRININSNCTAVLVDTGVGDAGPAFILTNGHCVDWLANGVMPGQALEGEVIFNYFADTVATQIAVPLAELVYSTMQGVDIAIIRLDATLGDMAARGISAFPIAEAPLDLDATVRVIGAPSSGYDPEEAYLREEICTASAQVDVLEFTWHFYDEYLTSCQDIRGGSSGSPLFSTESHEIYALVNTTVEGSSACYLGVPCEIKESGVWVNKGASYATPVDGLGACFDEKGNFSLSDLCPLPSTDQPVFEDSSLFVSQPPLRWAVTVTGSLPYYRYKTGMAGTVDCRSASGYSDVISLADTPLIDEPVPDEEGFYLLCVWAGDTADDDAHWQLPLHPSVAIAQIDVTPPQLEPQIEVMESPEYLDILFIFQPPEISDYIFKIGPVDTTDCAVEDGYERYRRIPPSIDRLDLPVRFCLIGFDHADNPTPPLDTVFEK